MTIFRKLTLSAILVFSSITASYASDECRLSADIAKKVMTDRQNKVTIVEALDATEARLDKKIEYISNKYPDREEAEYQKTQPYLEARIYELLIPLAYQAPAYKNKEYKDSITSEFINSTYKSCIAKNGLFNQ